jgi:hypothetical protein
LIAVSLLITIAFSADRANACSCYPTKTVDKELATSENVVILKHQSTHQNEGEAVNYLMSVEKVFKGNLKTGEVLTFTVDSNCSSMFPETEIGVEYLFYLGTRPANGRKWVGSICSRSGRLKDRANDLRYLNDEKRLRGKTRLSGRMEKLITKAAVMTEISVEPLAGRKISITGKGKTIVIETDENGFYEIYDLAPGNYRILSEKIDGYFFNNDRTLFVDVKITPNGQSERNIFYISDNVVSGTVSDPAGRPLKNVCLDLFPSRFEMFRMPFDGNCTDAKGFFEFVSVPTGSYHLVINPANRWSQNPYFTTFYFPQAMTRDEATEIDIGPGFFLRDLKIVVPEMFETVTVNGSLLFSDGQPASGEIVQFLKDGELPESKSELTISSFDVKTDLRGRFTLRIIKGQNGILRGLMYTYRGEFRNCPEIDKILDESDKPVQQINSDILKVETNANLSGIILKFPFPKCRKKRGG